jgi:hypothetical protein
VVTAHEAARDGGETGEEHVGTDTLEAIEAKV